MLYNFVAESFHTKKLCSRLSSSEVRFSAPSGGLGATYDDHLRFIGEHVVDLLLVLTKLILLGVTAETLRANIVQNRRLRSNGGRLTQYFR